MMFVSIVHKKTRDEYLTIEERETLEAKSF